MPGINDPQRKKKIRFERRRGVALMHDLIRFADQLGDMLGIEIEIEGTERLRAVAGGGTLIKLPEAAAPAPSSEVPFTVRENYSIVPGLVGLLMPTIGGVRLDNSPAPTLSIPSSGTRYAYFQLNFSLTYNNGYLASYTLDSVAVVVSSSSSIASTDATKYIAFCTFVNGVPSNSYVNKSPVPVALWDNGFESTLLRVGNL